MGYQSKTSLIIPCYFASEYLIDMTVQCISSLRHGVPDEVIIVDDGSPLDPTELGVVFNNYIRLEDNGGFAKAVNTGLEMASGDILIISNNDVVFTPKWLTGLLKPLYEGFDLSTIRTSNHTTETEDKITEGDKFDAIWAMKRHVYEKIGRLDESFGNYFEDTDYRKRAENAGFRIGKNHNAMVYHESKATVKIVDPTDSYYHTAMERYKIKHGQVD